MGGVLGEVGDKELPALWGKVAGHVRQDEGIGVKRDVGGGWIVRALEVCAGWSCGWVEKVIMLVGDGEDAEGGRFCGEGVEEFKEDFGGVKGVVGGKGEGVGVGDGKIEGVVCKEEVVNGCVAVVRRGGDVVDVGNIFIIVVSGGEQ